MACEDCLPESVASLEQEPGDLVEAPAAVVPPVPAKPGILTTEFWSTMIIHLTALAALFGGDVTGVSENSESFAVVASVIAQGIYTYSRTRAKSSAAIK